MDEPKPKKSVYEEIEELYGDQGDAKSEPEPEAAKTPATARPVAAAVKPIRRKSGISPITVVVAIVVSLSVGSIAGYKYEKTHLQEHFNIVLVNGVPISREEFEHRLDVASGNPVIKQMVLETLQEQFFKNKNSLPSESEVDTAYSNVMKNKENAASINASRQSPEDVKRQIRLQLAQSNLLKSGVAVTDQDVQTFYDINVDHRNPKALYYQPDLAIVDVIVTKSDASIQKAQAALLSGEAFADVAKQYSMDQSSAAQGGRLDVIRRGQTPLLTTFPEVGRAIFQMIPGNTRGPIQSRGTFWIIRCEKAAKERTLPFSAVKDDARTRALLAKGQQVNGKQLQTDFADFQSNSKIEVKWAGYSDALATKKAQ